jgi:hypothetical protein
MRPFSFIGGPRRASLVLLTLLMLSVLCNLSSAIAADVYVIAHPSAKVGADVIRDIYIGEKQFAGEVKIIPVDNATAQADFLEKVLRLDPTRYANLWVKKSFRDALNPPATRNSDKDIIDFVRKTPGAIAYVSSSPPPGVVLIQKF